tara:strand:- start:247 stop:1068 length:822 start_codon:yes stop_codon:yes gene_type:complete
MWKVPIPQDIDDWFGSDVIARELFIRLLLKARVNDAETPSMIHGIQYQLKRGQVLFSRKSWSDAQQRDGSVTTKALYRLRDKHKLVTTESTTKFTIVSIQNYDEITSMRTTDRTTNEQPIEQQANNKRTGCEQHTHTTKEYKKERYKKEREDNSINTIVEKKSNHYDLILESWNTFAKRNGLSEIRQLTPKRINGIKARQRQNGFNIQEIFDCIQGSPYLLGNEGNNWKVDFDWVFGSPNNWLKIVEGNYTKNKTKAPQDELQSIFEDLTGEE